MKNKIMRITKKLNKRLKKPIALALILSSVITLCSPAMVMKVEAETANDRVGNNIDLARSKTVEEVDLSKITSEELRLLGIFLSNFYIPLGTELYQTDEEYTKETKALQVQILKEACSFDEGVANLLVEAVWQASLGTATPLNISKSSDSKGSIESRTYEKLIGTDTTNARKVEGEIGEEIKASWLNFLKYSSTAENATYTESQKGLYDELGTGEQYALTWGASNTPVLLINENTGGTTGKHTSEFIASYASIAYAFKDVPWAYGVGSSLIATSKEDFDKLSEVDKSKVAIATQQMYVDCFGNILLDLGTSLIVVLPAALNPLVFTDGDGGNWGSKLQGVSLPVLASTETDSVEGKIDNGLRHYKFNLDTSKNTEGNPYAGPTDYRAVRGENKTSLDDSLWPLYLGGATGLSTYLQNNTNIGYNTSMNVLRMPSLLRKETGTPLATDESILKTDYITNVHSDFVYIDNLNLPGTDDWSLFTTANGGIMQTESGATVGDSVIYNYTDSSTINIQKIENKSTATTLTTPANLEVTYTKGLQIVVETLEEYSKKSLEIDRPIITIYSSTKPDAVYSTSTIDVEKGKGQTLLVTNGIAWSASIGVVEEKVMTQVVTQATLKKLSESSSDIQYVASQSLGSTQVSGYTSAQAKKYALNIYLSYVLGYFGEKNANGELIVDFTLAPISKFPTMASWEFDASLITIDDDAMLQELFSLAYYFLHPVKGITYVASWFNTKIAGILVMWHENIVGASDGAYTTGSTKYLGFSGYVTVPELTDMEWTSNMLNMYDSIVVYMVIIIFLIMMLYCMVGIVTFQRAIMGTVMFAILAFLPPVMINTTVVLLNTTCDNIYGNKFTYWAVVQHEQYIDTLNKSLEEADEGNTDSYLAFVFNNANGSQSDYTKIKLKWLAPKKTKTNGEEIEEELESATGNSFLTQVMNNAASVYDGESYANEGSLYMYRDYGDLYLYASRGYDTDDWYGLSQLNVSEENLSKKGDISTKASYNGSGQSIWSVYNTQTYSATKETTTPYFMKHGFIVNTSNEDANTKTDLDNRSYTYLLDSGIYGLVEKNNENLLNGKIKEASLDITSKFSSSSFGLSDDDFAIGLPELNKESGHSLSGESATQTSGVGAYYFGLYTESPYYYFYWNILDQLGAYEFEGTGLDTEDGLGLLKMYTQNNQEYFYNYSDYSYAGFGEMRDYTNLHGLFYYVIPYLKEVNKGVLAWSELYGTHAYDDVVVDSNNQGEVPKEFATTDDYSDEYIYKWWHNYNVDRIFNTYTPWVDLIYSCDYAKSETLIVAGEKYLVIDPLDPTSYVKVDSVGNIVEGRPMVFSKSEMNYYGLTEKDLTQVEQKLINVGDVVYAELLQLMDYYTFDRDTLVTASSMMTTFAFNEEFSQSKWWGTDYTLYPQSYELKAFSYDAYLRMILSETTGESLQDTSSSVTVGEESYNSFYMRIVENSSILTGVCFIVLDFIAVYIIPLLKMLFLVGIFYLSIILLVASVIKLDNNLGSVMYKALVEPLAAFLGVSVGLAWIVSLFMSNGNTAVTGRTGITIALGDPTMVTIFMIILNIVAVILYWKICWRLYKRIVTYTKAIFTSIGGVIQGAAANLKRGMNTVGSGTRKAGRVATSPVRGLNSMVKRRRDRKITKALLAGGIAGGVVGGAVASSNEPKKGYWESKKDSIKQKGSNIKQAGIKTVNGVKHVATSPVRGYRKAASTISIGKDKMNKGLTKAKYLNNTRKEAKAQGMKTGDLLRKKQEEREMQAANRQKHKETKERILREKAEKQDAKEKAKNDYIEQRKAESLAKSKQKNEEMAHRIAEHQKNQSETNRKKSKSDTFPKQAKTNAAINVKQNNKTKDIPVKKSEKTKSKEKKYNSNRKKPRNRNRNKQK